MMRNSNIKTNQNEHIEISPTYYLGGVCSTILRWLFLIAISYVILYPIIYMFTMSIRSTADFYDLTVVWVPKIFTFDHFKSVILQLNIWKPMLNTFLITLICTVAQMLVTSIVGYGFARFKFKGAGALFALVIFTVVVPPQMLNMSNYLLMRNFDLFGLFEAILGRPTGVNLLDSYWAFIAPAFLGMGLRSGLLILIFRQFYAAIPTELEEAALIDGCGFFKTYVRIMMPNLSNTFCLCAIFSMVWYWTDYFYSVVVLPSMKTMALQVSDIQNLLYNRKGLWGGNTVYNLTPKMLAACLIFILPLVIFFLLIQKRFSQSIENSGLVG